MNADALGIALSWLGGTAEMDRLDDAFVAAAQAALRAQARDAGAAIERLDDSARRRLLRAPEVTRRLLFPTPVPGRGDAAGFVARAAAVEAALAGTGPVPATASWTALGDAFVQPDGTAYRWPQLGRVDGPALDFGSPWAHRVDLSGRHEFTRSPRRPFTPDEVRLTHDRVTATFEALADVSPVVVPFVARATCVLVLQPHPDAPDQVASGTNGNYVGRSFLTNPHRAEATLACLAEGIVHEAIHGLLYRDAFTQAWVSGHAAHEVPRVESPWTGRALPVRPYLEAACVWFGLVHLWALAYRAEAFEPEIARRQLLRAVAGFGAGPLVDRVRPWWGDIRADVLETVDGLQDMVVDVLAGAP
jgi:hypothetical protein